MIEGSPFSSQITLVGAGMSSNDVFGADKESEDKISTEEKGDIAPSSTLANLNLDADTAAV